MGYKLSFKNKYTGNKWVSQSKNVTHATLKGVKSVAKYIKNQHDPEGNLVKTQVRIRKVTSKKKGKR